RHVYTKTDSFDPTAREKGERMQEKRAPQSSPSPRRTDTQFPHPSFTLRRVRKDRSGRLLPFHRQRPEPGVEARLVHAAGDPLPVRLQHEAEVVGERRLDGPVESPLVPSPDVAARLDAGGPPGRGNR